MLLICCHFFPHGLDIRTAFVGCHGTAHSDLLVDEFLHKYAKMLARFDAQELGNLRSLYRGMPSKLNKYLSQVGAHYCIREREDGDTHAHQSQASYSKHSSARLSQPTQESGRKAQKQQKHRPLQNWKCHACQMEDNCKDKEKCTSPTRVTALADQVRAQCDTYRILPV